jgi:hypothetical protein
MKKRLINFWQKKPNPTTKTLLKDICLVSFIIFAIFSWLNFINPQALPQLFKPFVVFTVFLTSLLFFFKEKIHSNLDEFLKYCFLIPLLAVTIGSLNFEFIQTTPILNNIVDFLKQHTLTISITSIIFGFSLFYKNREKLKNINFNKNNKFQNFSILLIIFILFLATKLFFILNYSGNFADDWQHIIAGSTFLENGHFHKISNQFENGYMRGSYVSFTVAIFFYLFGKTLFVAKLVPAFIGLINFFLFHSIAK